MGCREDSRITNYQLALLHCMLLEREPVIDIVSTPIEPKLIPVKPKAKVVNHLTRMTPTEWCNVFGVEVIDPDGWRHGYQPDWNTRITRDMFISRFMESTTRIVNGEKYAKWKHLFH